MNKVQSVISTKKLGTFNRLEKVVLKYQIEKLRKNQTETEVINLLKSYFTMSAIK